ncbi:Bax inhibitor-1/YccA family protein [Prosthecochloris sp. N3]|uniref:Bax inhibitor-1/YccA family protein n=1 Tax=Prosthecochloris ethylica TaxID=2743976 RepID=A0ABR9XT14_9CHLB|nr:MULTISPECIES: Bax inhibitor-1/YccA family protein [Prosthecochloris]MEC9486683.1 Bax inhibitor-1/YccA family protein [Prosthecochloris sp.]MBF0586965.1 Bax inhibitor-1/YccA family protein [Prosthecochloris ethylica]MBF0637158.1 Bax inhibitor-1/YccA family protein [Prosthecochloris ethylica]NUK48166.1 Bax inhibitor-1/YccA family protein [Prosthecochloris ethylica]RNA65839.1 Bax inhibitor-1/YccA family protein [Prosthecochloris sp. ZM_2]
MIRERQSTQEAAVRAVSPGAVADVQTRVINQVYTWMTLGLALTATVGYYTAGTEALRQLIFSNGMVLIGLVVVQLGIVFGLSAAINRLSGAAATGLFILYAALTGLTFAGIFLVYTPVSIASTFFVTAGTFAAMAVFGHTTRRDLTKLGSIAFMALTGLIIAMLVNMFLQSSMLELAVSVIGVLLFTGLTAYDAQRIKEMAATVSDGEAEAKVAVMGALALYLDFINLFLMLLRFLGVARDE